MQSLAPYADFQLVVETIFDTFLTAYCNTVNAMVLMLEKRDPSQPSEKIAIWMKARLLADDALKLLRGAHHMRNNWTNADELAQVATSKLKER
jgi:uncharacterized protein YutE (UPF0331/DUF86 family)